MKSISKKDINKALAEYRRLDDYDKLFLLCTTLNPFSNALNSHIFGIIDNYDGENSVKISRVEKIKFKRFLVKNYPKYRYENAKGRLVLTGKMTEEEKIKLQSIYSNRSDRNTIKQLFQGSQDANNSPNAQRALDQLKEIATICDIGNAEYFIDIIRYIKNNNHQFPPRSKSEPYNIIPDDNKFIVEIKNYAIQEDFKMLYNKYIKFKERNNLFASKTVRARKSHCFEKQVIAYNKRIISEMKKNPIRMYPKEYNAFIPDKYGVFNKATTIRKSKRKINNMLHAISHVMEKRKNNPFKALPPLKKRYL